MVRFPCEREARGLSRVGTAQHPGEEPRSAWRKTGYWPFPPLRLRVRLPGRLGPLTSPPPGPSPSRSPPLGLSRSDFVIMSSLLSSDPDGRGRTRAPGAGRGIPPASDCRRGVSVPRDGGFQPLLCSEGRSGCARGLSPHLAPGGERRVGRWRLTCRPCLFQPRGSSRRSGAEDPGL